MRHTSPTLAREGTSRGRPALAVTGESGSWEMQLPAATISASAVADPSPFHPEFAARIVMLFCYVFRDDRTRQL